MDHRLLWRCSLVVLFSVNFTRSSGKSQDTAFTFILPAGRTECFFQPTAKNGSMELEYQVLAGSGLDVGFSLISPNGHRLVSEFRMSDGLHLVDPTEEGDYRLCFDNSFSRLVEKMVFVEVIVGSQEEADEGWAHLMEPENALGYKLDDIKEVMETIHKNLQRSGQTQAVLRALETRDRYLLEDNLWRVSFWSSVSLLLMLTVAFAQVYTVHRFFQDHRVYMSHPHIHTHNVGRVCEGLQLDLNNSFFQTHIKPTLP